MRAFIVCDCCGVESPIVDWTATEARAKALRIGWCTKPGGKDSCALCLACLQPCNRHRAP